MEQNNISFWRMTAPAPPYTSLGRSIRAGVLIIGGGITGVTCAYSLAKKGLKPVLIEAGALCGGTTGNTTGKVTIQHGLVYASLIKKYGESAAADYADSQSKALKYVLRHIEDETISCRYESCPSYIYAVRPEEEYSLEDEYRAAVKIGISAELTRGESFPPGCRRALAFKDQAAFHPIMYVNALAAAAVAHGAEIYCNTKAAKVEEGEPVTVYCDDDTAIRADHLVMATQYPIYDGPNLFFTRLFARRSYGTAFKTEKVWPAGNYISAGEPDRSVRTHTENGERVLIVVGDGHPTGRGEADTSVHYENLIGFARSIIGDGAVPAARWSAQDYITADNLPYIGRIKEKSNIYAACGFAKWGLSNGTLAGYLISGLIERGESGYEKLYSPRRPALMNSPAAAIKENAALVSELIKSKFEPTEGVAGLARGEGRVIKYGGKKAGIYRDFNDNVTILDISCTHMTTELNFNSAEKTWDCPAHGGRYNIEGELLEGPPKNPLKVYFKGKYDDLADKTLKP